MAKIKTIFLCIRDFFGRHPFILFAVLGFAENLVIECLSRHSVVSGVKHLFLNPMPFLINTLIIVFTLSFSLLFRRRVFGLVIFSAPWLICGIINGVLLSYRVTPLGAIDFQIAKAGLVLMYLSLTQRVLLYVGIGLFFMGIIALWIIGPKISGKINYGKNVAAITGLLIAVLISVNLARSIKAVSSDFGNLVGAYNDYGFVYCFSSSVLDTGIDKPADYSEEAVNNIIAELPATTDATELIKPDVVLIQLESFIDPKYIKNLTFSSNPAPVHTLLREKYSGGMLYVPSFGSGTANTEFEVLTGISMDSFGPGEYPYKTVLLEKPCESVAYNLKELGYSAHAIHNHTGNFYDRDKVYPHLGFDSFQSKEYMYDFDTTPYGWCKDSVLAKEIITALDCGVEEVAEGEEAKPHFVWTVSVQGHGKYPSEHLANAENVIKVDSDEYSPEQLCALSYYVNQMWEMDMFLGSLISALEERGKPVLLVAYGDHLPSIGISSEDVTLPDVYTTEYVSWNNFGMEKDRGDIFSYELSAKMLQWLGFNNGNITKLHQSIFSEAEADNELAEKKLNMLSYDMLYGEEFQFEENPYKVTDMRMGTRPIVVDSIQVIGSSLYIKGSGFTEKSTVFINDRRQDTAVLSQYSLMVASAQIEAGDSVSVGQASSKKEFLSYSEPVIYEAPTEITEE